MRQLGTESTPSRAAQPLTMPPGESPELLERGRGAAQLPGGQQDGLVLRHLLEGTAHACAEVWHIAHGHGQLRKAGDSAGCTPQHAPALAPTPHPTHSPLHLPAPRAMSPTRCWAGPAPGHTCSALPQSHTGLRRRDRPLLDSICVGSATAHPASALGGLCPRLTGSLGGKGTAGPSPQRLGPWGPSDVTWGGDSAH